ncbi:HDOD domain-containing protein [Desulfobulbus sp.]|uniref:HDOD domain-containing protein n=1 Tax=Desulfobulbus sp. TaxID=895 RepID=UPI0027B8E2C7|nr:HDOD domain-containing protein [Desulfobulbus sp.]
MAAPLSLVEVINRFIESDAVTLPVFNSASSRIQQEMAKPEPSIQVIEKIITSDQALSSQVLKIANSSFYRGLAEIGTVRAAILRLGFKEIEQVVVLATSRQHFKSSDKTINLLMKKLWQHAVGCAYGTVWLARRYTYGVDQSQAFFGGLFHDVGKLLVLVIIEQVKRRNKTLKITDALLLEAMDKLHPREGAKLLAQWNMPEYFCVIARDHHSVEIDDKNFLLLLVRMANMVCHKLGIGLSKNPTLILPATLEAGLLNLTEIDLAELEIVLEDTAVLAD